MNTNKHMKIAGALQIVQAIPTFIFTSWYLALLIPEYQVGTMEQVDFLAFILLFSIMYLLGGAQAWFGSALLRQKQWTSRVVGIIFSALTCLPFPHVIGIYTLVVLIQANTMKTSASKAVD